MIRGRYLAVDQKATHMPQKKAPKRDRGMNTNLKTFWIRLNPSA